MRKGVRVGKRKRAVLPKGANVVLLLSSGFSNERVWERFVALVTAASYAKAVIVTSAREEKEKAFWAQKTYEQFASLGLETRFLDLEKDDPEAALTDADIVYVCGGNTFRLLRAVRQTSFPHLVRTILDKGGLYVGSSAGALLATLSIQVAADISPDVNKVGITDLTALTLVPFHVVPHFEERDTSDVEAFRKAHGDAVETVADGEGLLVGSDGSFERIGFPEAPA